MTEATIQIWPPIFSAFRWLFSDNILLSKFFLKYFALYVAIMEFFGFIDGFVRGMFRVETHGSIAGVLTLLNCFLLAPFVIALHRRILLNDEFPTHAILSTLNAGNLRFGSILLLFALPIAGATRLMNLSIALDQPDIAYVILFFIIAMIVIYPFLAVRIIIYLPFLAVGEKTGIRDSFLRTAGSTWSLWFGNLLVGLFGGGLGWLINLMSVAQAQYPMVIQFLFDLVMNLGQLLFIALTVAVVSYWAKFFREKGSAVAQ